MAIVFGDAAHCWCFCKVEEAPGGGKVREEKKELCIGFTYLFPCPKRS